jgi:hypothetical protein
MNKMDIQCPFKYLACVQIPFATFAFGLLKDLKGATAYKHAVALESRDLC